MTGMDSKTLIFICAIIAYSNGANFFQYSPKLLESTVIKVAECVRDVLDEGDHSLGIPPLNPLDLEEGFIDLTALGIRAIKGNITLKNVKAERLTHFKILNLNGKLSLLPFSYALDYEVSFEDVYFETYYDLVLMVGPVYITSRGDINLQVSDFNINGDLKVAKGFKLEDFNTKLGLSGFNITATGILLDEKLSKKVSKLLTENVPILMEQYNGEISAVIKEVIMRFLSKTTSKRSLNIPEFITNCLKG